MRRTATRRVRALVVAGALAVGMIAGPAAASAAPPDHAQGPASHAPGLLKEVEARSNGNGPWYRAEEEPDDDGGLIVAMGWSWL